MTNTVEEFNEKNKFIIETLLPYLIKESNECEEKAEQAASMIIFPYKTQDGVKLGSLKEPNVFWYYLKEEKEISSSGSYRIIADNLMSENQAINFRQAFREYGYISGFTDDAVILDLITKMKEEKVYTKLWWQYAYDVFALWNSNESKVDLAYATYEMDNNSYLFLDGYCDKETKNKLIYYKVFNDILTDEAKAEFWDKINDNEKEKAITVLKNMGVPHTFNVGNDINFCLLSFLKKISESDFPVKKDKNEAFDKCNLCHNVIFEHIYEKHQSAFEALLNIEEGNYKSGLVMKNVNGEYVPLSWDLFYRKTDFKAEDVSGEAEYNEVSKEINQLKGTSDNSNNFLEQLHVDVSLYKKDIVDKISTLNDFALVNDTAGKYNLGASVEPLEFYKWIWSYSKHKELAMNILVHFTGDDRETVPKECNDFVIEVLGIYSREIELEWPNEDYQFNIDMEVAEAFKNSGTINTISRMFNEVYVVIEDNWKKHDISDFILKIGALIEAPSDVKTKIVTDSIWDHAYLTNNIEDSFHNNYVRCKRDDDGAYRDVLIFCSSNEEYLLRAMASYIRDQYNVGVTISEVNWKDEYLNLARGIHDFITNRKEEIKRDDTDEKLAKTDDVINFNDEKLLWQNMKDQREIIMTQEIGKTSDLLKNWRPFLSNKYKGRCQLCWEKIITGQQNSHFYTYRIIKESENQLANMSLNMFCLCPSCHGEMRYGDYMGKDLSEIKEKAKKYSQYIEEELKNGDEKELGDETKSLISQLADENSALKGFNNPIVCQVIVNGKERNMAFSWEHFMKIAFILSEEIDGEDSENGGDNNEA